MLYLPCHTNKGPAVEMKKRKSRWLSTPARRALTSSYNQSWVHLGCVGIVILPAFISERLWEVKVGKGGRNFLLFLITQRTCLSATCQHRPRTHPVWPLVCGRRSPLSLPVRRRSMSPTLMVVGSERLQGAVNNPHHLSYRQVTPQLSFFCLKVLVGAFQSKNGARILRSSSAVYIRRWFIIDLLRHFYLQVSWELFVFLRRTSSEPETVPGRARPHTSESEYFY